MCGAVKIAVLTEERTAIFTAPLAVILVAVEQLVVGQASLLYNIVIGEVDFTEAVADFHVEDVTGNVCDIAAEISHNLAYLSGVARTTVVI